MGRGGLKRADSKSIQKVILYMITSEMVSHFEASHKLHVVNILAAFLLEKYVATLSPTTTELETQI